MTIFDALVEEPCGEDLAAEMRVASGSRNRADVCESADWYKSKFIAVMGAKAARTIL